MPTLVFLAPAGVCVLAWMGVGTLVPRRWCAGDVLLGGLTRIAFGSVAFSLAFLGFGRVGLFDRPLLVGVTVVAGLAGVPVAWRLIRCLPALRRGGRLEQLVLGSVALALVLDLVASTAPPTSADALKYHLALPRLWLQLGSIGNPFWRWEGFNPSAIEMLYAQGLALGGGSSAAVLHAVFGVLCAAAIFGLARELGGNVLAGLVAAFLFVLQGIVTWEATSAFIELGLSFYVVLAVWYGVRVVEGRDAAVAVVWVGAFAGAAAGTKYLGLVPAALVLAALVVTTLARRAPFQALSACLAALATGGAWYVKNLIVAGNPLYPVVLGGKWMSSYASAQIHASLTHYGVGGSVLRLAILPLDLILHGGAFDRGQYVGTAIFLFALLAVLSRRRRPELVLAIGAVIYLVAWREESPQARFLLPAGACRARRSRSRRLARTRGVAAHGGARGPRLCRCRLARRVRRPHAATSSGRVRSRGTECVPPAPHRHLSGTRGGESPYRPRHDRHCRLRLRLRHSRRGGRSGRAGVHPLTHPTRDVGSPRLARSESDPGWRRPERSAAARADSRLSQTHRSVPSALRNLAIPRRKRPVPLRDLLACRLSIAAPIKPLMTGFCVWAAPPSTREIVAGRAATSPVTVGPMWR